VPES
jgi:hypothetical protein